MWFEQGGMLTQGIQWLLEKNGLFRIKATFGGICQFIVTALVFLLFLFFVINEAVNL